MAGGHLSRSSGSVRGWPPYALCVLRSNGGRAEGLSDMRGVRFQWKPLREQLMRVDGPWRCLPFYFPGVRLFVSVQSGPGFCSSAVYEGLDVTYQCLTALVGSALPERYPCERAATYQAGVGCERRDCFASG